jgi:hypothetical protein
MIGSNINLRDIGKSVAERIASQNPPLRAAHGYAPTGDAAMAAFAKSWRRE